MIKGIGNLQAYNYSDYNRIQNDPKSVQLAGNDQNSAQIRQEEDKSLPASGIDLRLEDIRPRANAKLEDISLSLNEPGGFEMKGRQSDIESLDIEKAVSDMQKDQALMQYQYFVGDTNLGSSEDGIVIAK